MKTTKKEKKVSSLIIETPTATRKKVSAVAVKFREKKLFQDKVDAARMSLTGLKVLPS